MTCVGSQERQISRHRRARVSQSAFIGGIQRVFAFGAAKPDAIFEIGSITKTFTGLILAHVEQGRVILHEPVRDLLPPGTVPRPQGAEITLFDLTQHSGLPRMPDNFNPANPQNPYVDYDADKLYAAIAAHGVELPSAPKFLYSVGDSAFWGRRSQIAPDCRMRTSFDRRSPSPSECMTRSRTSPLNKNGASFPDTSPITIRPCLGISRPSPCAGAIRSTAADMLKYLEAELHPDRVNGRTRAARTLPGALRESQRPRARRRHEGHIACAWLMSQEFPYWHNGATGGYSAFAFFNPRGDFATVVLLNTAISPRRTFEKLLAEHINERLLGQEAIDLGPPASE